MDTFRYIEDNIDIPNELVFNPNYKAVAVQEFKKKYLNKCFGNMLVLEVINVKSHTRIMKHDDTNFHMSVNILVRGKVYNNMSIIKSNDVIIDNKSIKYSNDYIVSTYNEEFSSQGAIDNKYKQPGTIIQINLPTYNYLNNKVLSTASIVMDKLTFDNPRILITSNHITKFTEELVEQYNKLYNSLDDKTIKDIMNKYYIFDKLTTNKEVKNLTSDLDIDNYILSIDPLTLTIHELDDDDYDVEMTADYAVLSLLQMIATLKSNIIEITR